MILAPLLSVGDVVNIKRRKRGGKVPSPSCALNVVGMDIGYVESGGPEGQKYCLMLVDASTRHTWVYGLSNLKGTSITDALWAFFIDAGGLPTTIQCDFDPRFMGGHVRRLWLTSGITLRSAPPGRQSANGLVDRHRKTACNMA